MLSPYLGLTTTVQVANFPFKFPIRWCWTVRYLSVQKIREKYGILASIPIPESAEYRNSTHADLGFKIKSTWKSHDLKKNKATLFTRSHVGTFVTYTPVGNGSKSMNIISSVIHESSSIALSTYSPRTKLTAVLTTELKKDKDYQFIEIWNEERKICTHDVMKLKQHGKIYDDGTFSTFVWNSAGEEILYIAEKLTGEAEVNAKNTIGDGDQPDNETEVFPFRENWGEVQSEKLQGTICSLNVLTGIVKNFPKLDDHGLSCGQAIWAKENAAIVFVGWNFLPFPLGVVHCTNRRSAVYCYEIKEEKTYMISHDSVSVRSPRSSPDDTSLVYLENDYGGPHHSCSRLMQYEWKTGAVKVIVDIVQTPSGDQFPGIFAENLPKRCWSANSTHVLFSTIWRSRNVIISVNVKSGHVMQVPIPYEYGSAVLLDIFDDIVVASISSLNMEPILIAGRLRYLEGDNIEIQWTLLDDYPSKLIPDVKWKLSVLDPLEKNVSYPDLNYEMILVHPKVTSGGVPMLLWPHGGPHSAITNKFEPLVLAFVQLGFAVCLVNYRGSTGYGNDGVFSLLGHIGEQDITDVHHAGCCARKEFVNLLDKDSHISKVVLFGGSHGGFIAAHLSCRFPDSYAVCVCRNPVVDLCSMAATTDIPDWVWVEAGCGNKQDHKYYEHSKEMWSRSPLRLVSKNNIPTLLLVGKKDKRVPSMQSLQYYRALVAEGVPCRMFVYDDDGHALSSTVAGADCVVQTVMWVLQHEANVKSIP